MSADSPIRLGLIGLGRHMLQSLLPNLLANPDFRVVAAADPDPGRRQLLEGRFSGIRSFDSGESLLARAQELELHGVMISTHPGAQLRCVRLAVEQRLDLFVEKPPSPTAAELAPAARLAAAQGVISLVGCMWRFTKGMQVLESWRGGRPDRKVRHLCINATFPAAIARSGWSLGMPELAFHDMLIHAIDCSAALVGQPESVRVETTPSAGAEGAPARVSFTIVMRHPSAAVSVICAHIGSARYHVALSAVTDDGSFVQLDDLTRLSITPPESWSGTFGSFRDHPSLDWEPGQLYRGYARHGYAEELAAFADCIRRRTPTPLDLTLAVQDMLTMEACLRSHHEQRTVTVPRWEDIDDGSIRNE